MNELEGRGCDVPVSPVQSKPAREKRVFSPRSIKRANELRNKARKKRKEDVAELKAIGAFTNEMAEKELSDVRKQAEANAR
jgi:hypothetical protein